jgi:phosphoglycerate kinase
MYYGGYMNTNFPKKTLKQLPLHGATVLVRVDYNVPMTKDGKVGDDYRLRMSLPTLEYLLSQGCKVIACSHMGRPDGKPNPKYSMEPVAERLGELLKTSVGFVPECIGDQVRVASKNLKPGGVLMLENLRFHPEEEENDKRFAENLAKDSGANYLVQDAFGAVHRSHASLDAITHFLPSAAGLLLEREVTTINKAMQNPEKPLVAVIGGAKIETKIKIIERFVDMADAIIIGGALANNFLKYKGLEIGKSVHDDGFDDTMKSIFEAIERKLAGAKPIDEFLLLPTDVAVGKSTEPGEQRVQKKASEVASDELILDIGPESIEKAVRVLGGAKTVVWNGTMGYAELEQFSHGSARVALQLAQQPQTTSIIGGGDTADFVLKWDAKNGGSFTHVSTGGGASLDLMAGKTLPGVASLLDA